MFTNLAILGASHCNFCGFCSALSVDLTVSPPAKRHLTRREICGSAMWKICASLRDGHVSFHSECWGNTVSLYIYIYICVCVNMYIYIYIHTYYIYYVYICPGFHDHPILVHQATLLLPSILPTPQGETTLWSCFEPLGVEDLVR